MKLQLAVSGQRKAKAFLPQICADERRWEKSKSKSKSLNHKGHEGTQRGKPGSIERIAKTLRS
jgi:hypothetical protein